MIIHVKDKREGDATEIPVKQAASVTTSLTTPTTLGNISATISGDYAVFLISGTGATLKYLEVYHGISSNA